jgi:hypothetical protein
MDTIEYGAGYAMLCYLFILPQRYYLEPDSRSVMSFPSGKVENDYRILKSLDGGNF